MEDQLIHFLGQTQSIAEGPRRDAERHLLSRYNDNQFPLALVAIASHAQAQLAVRQSALLALKAYILAGWSTQFDEFQGELRPDDATKSHLREALFQLSISDQVEAKIQAAAANAVAKIAYSDLPDAWPGLLPSLLAYIPSASTTGLHGALKVLSELVKDGFDEAQFFQVANDFVAVLHAVASDSTKRLSLRALAISIFKESFKLLEMVLEEKKAEIMTFAEHTVNTWMTLFLGILDSQLPAPPLAVGASGENTSLADYRGLISLKVQVAGVRTRLSGVNARLNRRTDTGGDTNTFPEFVRLSHADTILEDMERTHFIAASI